MVVQKSKSKNKSARANVRISEKANNQPPQKKSFANATKLYRIRQSPLARSKPKKAAPKVAKRKFKPIPKTRTLIADTVTFVWKNRTTLIWPVIVYALLYMLLVTGFSGTISLPSIQQGLEKFLGNHPLGNKALTTGLVIAGVGSPSSDNAGGKVYQAVLPVIGTIVFIWTLRRLKNGQSAKVREAFYFSMQPFFPVLLVLISIAIRLMPLLGVSYVFAITHTNGFAASSFETILFVLLWAGVFLATLLWITPVVLALYGVTLPDVYPGQAIKASKYMVRGQRLTILGRILGGVALGSLVGVVLVFLCIVWLPGLVVPVTLMLEFIGLMLLHAYLFNVYRSLL